MTCTADAGERESLGLKAKKITELTMLIQEFPKETRVIIDAVEDGLTLGPAQVVDGVHCLDADADADDESEESAPPRNVALVH